MEETMKRMKDEVRFEPRSKRRRGF